MYLSRSYFRPVYAPGIEVPPPIDFAPDPVGLRCKLATQKTTNTMLAIDQNARFARVGQQHFVGRTTAFHTAAMRSTSTTLGLESKALCIDES